jgi:hypothetical protein
VNTVVRRCGYTLAAWSAVLAAAVGWAVNQERRAAKQPPPLRTGPALRLPAQRTPVRMSEGASGGAVPVSGTSTPSTAEAAPPPPPLRGHRG